jgi:hypothetical protein
MYEEIGDNGTALVKRVSQLGKHIYPYFTCEDKKYVLHGELVEGRRQMLSQSNKRGSNDDFRIERCFVETPFYYCIFTRMFFPIRIFLCFDPCPSASPCEKPCFLPVYFNRSFLEIAVWNTTTVTNASEECSRLGISYRNYRSESTNGSRLGTITEIAVVNYNY